MNMSRESCKKRLLTNKKQTPGKMHPLKRISTMALIKEGSQFNADKKLKSLYNDLFWQQAIGRPASQKQRMIKVLMNVILVFNAIRCAVIMWYPNLSREAKIYLGNLMEELGYNNSRMFYMTGVTFAGVVIAFQIVFELAEHRNHKEFLNDVFDLENKLQKWNLSAKEQNEMRANTVTLVAICRLMAVSGVSVTVLMLFVALVLKIRHAGSAAEIAIAVVWHPIISLYIYRQTTVFFYTLIILFVSVQVINLRYLSLNKDLERARTDAQFNRFMDRHDEVTLSCHKYNKTFKWMLFSVNNLSTPAVAVCIYNVVFSNFDSQLDRLNALVFCFLVTTCTLMITFIPSGTTRNAQSAYPVLMSAVTKVKLSYGTRRRLLIFCKRMSTLMTGEIGFSNGSQSTFTKLTAVEFLINLMGMWFMYASIRLGL